MAKTRAQRKAERRRRQAQQERQKRSGAQRESEAQHRTQVGESADVLEAELAEHGADLESLKETAPADGERPQPDAAPAAPAPSRADVGRPGQATAEAPAEEKLSRWERRRAERERRKAAKESQARREQRAEPAERRRGAVMSFFISVISELRRVQWPDRQTLIQASAITLVFIGVMAAYLGLLDAIFNWVVQAIL